jgi:hypothetical protein
MIEYYPLVLISSEKKYYCIWYANEKNGFIKELNKVKKFNNMKQLNKYASNQNIKIETEKTTFSIDYAITWISNENKEVDCKYFLDLWNIIGDLADSFEDKFYGNVKKSILSKVYDKLLFGSNLEALTPEGKEYIPNWEKEEINEITNIVKDGLRIVNLYVVG